MNEREILYFLLHRREYIRQQRIALEQDLDDIEQKCDHLHVQYEAETRMIEELIEHSMSRVTEIRTVVFYDVYEYSIYDKVDRIYFEQNQSLHH